MRPSAGATRSLDPFPNRHLGKGMLELSAGFPNHEFDLLRLTDHFEMGTEQLLQPLGFEVAKAQLFIGHKKQVNRINTASLPSIAVEYLDEEISKGEKNK